MLLVSALGHDALKLVRRSPHNPDSDDQQLTRQEPFDLLFPGRHTEPQSVASLQATRQKRLKPGCSQDPKSFERFPRAHTPANGGCDPVLGRRLFKRGFDRLSRHFGGNDEDALAVAEDEIAGRNPDPFDFDADAKVDHFAARPLVLRVQSAAESRKAKRLDPRRIANESIENCAGRAPE